MDTVKISVKAWVWKIKPSQCRTLSNSKLLVHDLVGELLEENRLGWKMLPGRFLSKLLKVFTISETSNAKVHFTGVFEEFPCQHITLLWRLYHRSWVGSHFFFSTIFSSSIYKRVSTLFLFLQSTCWEFILRWVLTAAHCLDGLSTLQYEIMAGLWKVDLNWWQ